MRTQLTLVLSMNGQPVGRTTVDYPKEKAIKFEQSTWESAISAAKTVLIAAAPDAPPLTPAAEKRAEENRIETGSAGDLVDAEIPAGDEDQDDDDAAPDAIKRAMPRKMKKKPGKARR